MDSDGRDRKKGRSLSGPWLRVVLSLNKAKP